MEKISENLESKKRMLLKKEKFNYSDVVEMSSVEEVINMLEDMMVHKPKSIIIHGLEGIYLETEKLGLLWQYRFIKKKDDLVVLQFMEEEDTEKFKRLLG